MIINTVGKIILKNGQKVYKRFGAAVVLKIKLGTAAFANIVNNATTTEEGFVPDARVVAQQQQLIDQQQEAINSLNSAIGGKGLISLQALFEESCIGINCFSTAVDSKDLPSQTQEWLYAQGFLLKRNLTSGAVLLTSFQTQKIAINNVVNKSEWSGWRVI